MPTTKVAVVTGAGSGIGRALAAQLDQRGYQLALCDIDAEGLEETAAARSGGPLAEVVDVADRAAVEAFATAVRERYGRVDLVFNNAGVDLSQTLNDVSYEDFEWIFSINFWGVVHGTKAFLPTMLEQRSGTMVNVSSIFGMVAWPTHGTYVATKFAVRGFTEALRHELVGTGVKTLVVHPGGIDTDIVKRSRFYVDDAGRGSKEEMAEEFHKLAPTSPDKAASIILKALDKGRERVMVGPDAQAADRLVRFAPVRYFRVIRFLQRFARR